MTEAVLENVYAKLTAAGMLPDRSAAKNLLVPCCSTACTLCSCELEAAEAKSAYALCWDTGLQRVRYESRHCVTCGCSYSSCWRLGQAGTMYLCSTPLHLQFLQILAHPQADSCAFVECRLLVLHKPGGAPSRLLRRHSASIAGHNGCWPSSRPTPGALPGLDVLAKLGGASCR